MKTKRLLEYFQTRESEIINSIREFVDIESPSFDEQGSRNAVSSLVKEAEKLRCDLTIEQVFREGFGWHLLIHAFTNQNQVKPAMLLGHTDTVHPRGSFRQNPTRIETDKFYGCGIFDMKTNCVLMLEILRAFSELSLTPPRPITILLSCDEEIGSATGRELVEREAAKSEFCLVCEPSATGKVKTGRKGTAMFQIKARGIPAHAGLEPEKGASAILELAKQIPKIQRLNDYGKGTTANVCLISGGTASNVIPEYAECAVDVRFTSMSEARRIENEIKNLQPTDAKVSLEITGDINRPPLERNEKTLALYKQAQEIADQMNYKLDETQVGGASDGNFVAALGVPVLDGLGVAGDGAHTNYEHILVSDIAPRAALIASMLL